MITDIKDVFGTVSLQQALNEIYFYKGNIPHRALDVLVSQQSEATPFLLEILHNAILRHDRTGDYYVAHLFALLLLAQFKEKKAYPLVIKLLDLPIDSIDRLIGDMFTETMPSVVISVFDGNLEPLLKKFTESGVDDILRDVIGNCLTALIYQNMIRKEDIVSRLLEIIASGKMNENQGFYTAVANLVLNSKLIPLYDAVRAAFKVGLIDKHCMNGTYFENHLQILTEELVRQHDLEPVTDVMTELSQWSTYIGEKPITPKIDRNVSCPCGSGHKFKKCCSHRLNASSTELSGVKNVNNQYPLGTIACYGPNNQIATKIVVGIFKDRDEDISDLKKWFSDSGDIRNNHQVSQEIVDFLNVNGVENATSLDRIIGCPHEEGIDYPENEVCPVCPFWANRNCFRD